MKIQNFPDIDLPTVTVTAPLPGASPAQLETDVARKIENSIATLQGVKHIYTKVQDGSVDDRRSSSASRSRRRKRSTTCATRSRGSAPTCPPTCATRSIAKVDLAGSPILTYTVASSRMDDEALSLVRRQHGARSAAGGARRRRGRARRRRQPRGARRARPGAAAGAQRDRRRHLAPAAPDAARGVGRAHRRRRRRAVGAHDRHRAVGRRARAMEIALRDGRRIRLDQVAKVSDTVAELRSAALLERQAGGRLRDRAHARRRRDRGRRRRARSASSS